MSAAAKLRALRDSRIVRVLVGGSAVVGAGAATGHALAAGASSNAPDHVSAGQRHEHLDVEGQAVEVPTTQATQGIPGDQLDNAGAAAHSPENSAVTEPGVASASTSVQSPNTANTVSANSPDRHEAAHDNSGPGSMNSGPGSVNSGPSAGGDHSGPGPSGAVSGDSGHGGSGSGDGGGSGGGGHSGSGGGGGH